MHRYRLFGLFIDTPTADADASVEFWSTALGATPIFGDDEAYTTLDDAHPGLRVEVQAVDDTPRYHLDIETDDVPAETARLEEAGAVVVARERGYNVLRAPSGHLLCVVPVQSPREFFEANARTAD
jgi:catechol 2,3-dioxygenase-like lactoylglutathione lyase family enzyme